MPITIKPKIVAGGGLAAALALIVPFIAQHEGHANRTYHDVGGVLTICYGHTGPDVKLKMTRTDEQCKVLLDQDVQKFAKAVLDVNPELIDKPNILASAISFSYNIGVTNYTNSSVSRDFKAGQYKLGCSAMLLYVYAGGKYSRGLVNRRQDEYNICMKGT